VTAALNRSHQVQWEEVEAGTAPRARPLFRLFRNSDALVQNRKVLLLVLSPVADNPEFQGLELGT
jgi:hypothetical protein